MKVVLYSTHCPKCMVLEKKLESKLIKFEMITDVNIMKEKGMMSVPVLEVNDVVMQYADAIKWVNEQGETNEK